MIILRREQVSMSRSVFQLYKLQIKYVLSSVGSQKTSGQSKY